MSVLINDWPHLGAVAGKAALMYGTALLALRIGERRTIAQWTIIDFATAVAMGAIIGRTATSAGQSYVVGAAALVTLVAIHRVVSILRFNRLLGKVVDHRVRVLVARGEIRRTELRRCGLTDDDLFAQLRQQGVFSLDGVRYVLYETKGSITVVPEEPSGEERPLVQEGIANSVGYP